MSARWSVDELLRPVAPGSAGEAIARGLSIIGHPAIVMPAVAAAALASEGNADRTMSLALVTALVVGVMAYAWWQARTGRWRHIDAIDPVERRGFNRITLALIALAAAVAALSGAARLSAGLSAALLILISAASGARWFKLSQHVAFGSLGVVVAGSIQLSFGAGLALLTMAVAWSRLVLRRHDPADVLAGAAAGLIAGAVLVGVAPYLG